METRAQGCAVLVVMWLKVAPLSAALCGAWERGRTGMRQ